MFYVAALLAPSAVLFGFKAFMHEPASVMASVEEQIFVELPPIPESVLGYGRPEGVTVVGPTPFVYERAEDKLAGLPMQDPLPEATGEEAEPDFVLSTVLPGGNRSYAVINGKPYTTGQFVAEGWKLIEIRGQARSAVVQHTSGRKITLRMKQALGSP